VQAAVSSARNCRSRGPGTGHEKPRDRRNFRSARGPHRGHGRGLLRRPGRAPRGEPSGPEGPLGVADSLPPAVRIRRSPLCSRPPGNARRARLCGRIGTSGFLPVFWPSAREERGCPSAIRNLKRWIHQLPEASVGQASSDLGNCRHTVYVSYKIEVVRELALFDHGLIGKKSRREQHLPSYPRPDCLPVVMEHHRVVQGLPSVP
jgi:hypothetical protein